MSDAPDADREDWFTRYQRERAERRLEAEARAKATIAYLAKALRFFGVEKVTAEYDGYGDDGSTEAAAYHPTLPGELPFGLAEEIDGIWDAFLPSGCEINAGSFGTLTLDVATGGVVADLEYRDEEEELEDGETE